MRYLILDVFAEEKYAGNQLAVVFGAGHLSGEQMQALAREFHFSETTFVLSDAERDGGWDVRIFTPTGEVPFAGHPTLGTSWAIRSELIGEPVQRLVLHLKAGDIPVDLSYRDDGEVDLLWMRQLPPVFGETLEHATVAELLSVAESQVDTRFPAQEVSTGLPFLIVALRDLAAVRAARLDQQVYRRLVAEDRAKAVLLFAPETYHPDNDLNARMFADVFGVPEDPATGSANGCLAGYLVRHRYFGQPRIEARVEQGYEIHRPSLLRLAAAEEREQIAVRVGGRVVAVARGELL